MAGEPCHADKKLSMVNEGGGVACGRTVGIMTRVVAIQVSPYFDPTYTRTGWIGQPTVLDRHEVVTIDGDVDTLRQATP